MHPNAGTHSRKFGVRLRHCNFIDSVHAHAAERGECCEWGREVNLRLENVDAWNLSRDRTLERDIYTYIIFVTEAKYAIFYKQDIISCL